MKTFVKTLKILTILSAFGGVLLSLISAPGDNFSHPWKRLLYFTAQSNIWIGAVFLLILVLPFTKMQKGELWRQRLYLLKFIFTVSITMTGIVFCGVIAPFSPSTYRPWVFCNWLTHVVTPILAIADFFLDKQRITIKTKHLFACLLPPLFYFSVATLLGYFNFDFGRGEPYPYFFLDYRSPIGLFGVGKQSPFIGPVYWWTAFSLVMLLLAFIYAKGKRGKRS